jgi:hypothetical protein
MFVVADDATDVVQNGEGKVCTCCRCIRSRRLDLLSCLTVMPCGFFLVLTLSIDFLFCLGHEYCRTPNFELERFGGCHRVRITERVGFDRLCWHCVVLCCVQIVIGLVLALFVATKLFGFAVHIAALPSCKTALYELVYKISS